MTEIERLEVECRIAGAELGIIEELRWAIAGLATLLLEESYFHSWFFPITIGIAIFFVMPYWHSKKYDAAWDAFERTTGTGKHYRPHSADE